MVVLMMEEGSKSRRKQMWCPQPLTPLMEGPDPDMQALEFDATALNNKKETSSWEALCELFGIHNTRASNNNMPHVKRHNFMFLLDVLGCPLAPIPLPLPLLPSAPTTTHHHRLLPIKGIPFETSTAHYIIKQYLAATGSLKQDTSAKNMYASGILKMICCETEVSSNSGKHVKSLGTRSGNTYNGCFVIWQMSPGMWSLELVVGGNKVVAGSDGKTTVWRHTPWLGTHAAKGPRRPLRRIIQGLDPKSTASLFENAQCLGGKRIGDEECFVLKVSVDRAALMERNEGPAEVIRHVLYGYFSQKSGLLIYLEDSHLTRVQSQSPPPHHLLDRYDHDDAALYWETTIGSSIEDYREVDGVLIAHRGRSIATVFRFGETSTSYSRTRLEEIWTIDDVVFNVLGLSADYFSPPDIYVDNQLVNSP